MLCLATAVWPIHWAPRVLELFGCVAATAVIALYFVDGHEVAATERIVRHWQQDLARRINGLKVHAVQLRPHATTIVTTTAPNLAPQDYVDHLPALSAAYRTPATSSTRRPAGWSGGSNTRTYWPRRPMGSAPRTRRHAGCRSAEIGTAPR
jgi:hypothetical protein